MANGYALRTSFLVGILWTNIRSGVLREGSPVHTRHCDRVQLTFENSGMVSVITTTRMTLCHSILPKTLLNFFDLRWEPTENFHDCERLLNSFWTEVGEYKKEKTREGIEVIPRKQWIGVYTPRSCLACTRLIVHTREREEILQGKPGSRR